MSEPNAPPPDAPPPVDQPLRRAAQYIRMSTEHQQYSTENQSDAIQEYAVKRGYEVVRTYEDAGKSGLRIEGREALQKLLEDVQNRQADFETILVYDVSRWGRFQDSDESAFYEYACRRAGISVEYCAEQFENDGSPISTIIKGVKRAMAGEYSRELSAKVFKGQCRLIQLGYRQGGPAGYGLRRMLVGANSEHKGILKPGEQKSLQTDRVILLPGPQEEISNVRRIYEIFTKEGKQEGPIAEWLNAQGVVNIELARPWTRSMVRQVLTNEKYIGNNIYNRLSFKLKKKRVRNPPDMWVRSDGVFDPIVPTDLFFTARGIILERARRLTDEEMLDGLKRLLATHGTLSAALIDEAEGLPSSGAYQSRFGSLLKVYRLVGYVPSKDYRYVEINQHLHQLRLPFVDDLVHQLQGTGATIAREGVADLLSINGEYTALVVFTRCRQTQAGTLRWLVNLDQALLPDITVVVRMDAENCSPADFYLLPRIDMPAAKVKLAEANGVGIDVYCFENLQYFVTLAARTAIEVAA